MIGYFVKIKLHVLVLSHSAYCYDFCICKSFPSYLIPKCSAAGYFITTKECVLERVSKLYYCANYLSYFTYVKQWQCVDNTTMAVCFLLVIELVAFIDISQY